MAKSGVECFIWLTPYKALHTLDTGEVPFPTMTIIDVALLAKAEPHVYSANAWSPLKRDTRCL